MSEARHGPPSRLRAELQARRARRRRMRVGLGAAGIASLLATVLAPPVPRLVWNVSASAPLGLYTVVPGAALARGDGVVARMPLPVRKLAADRSYLPANVPLVKRVEAVPGDEVCARGSRLYVNRQLVAERLAQDRAGRPMPRWDGCARLRPDEFLLLMPAPASFDGRYFGPVRTRDILGKAVPLWVR